jgi:hypothetical protein
MEAGYVLVLVSALAVGCLIGSRWALLVTIPFVVVGLIAIDQPIEDGGGSWGAVILLIVALPVALALAAGVLLRTRWNRRKGVGSES